MPSTFSSNLRIELIASGEGANTWGNTTNTNLGTLIETAISGYVSLTTMTDADYTLIALNGANDQARQMYLNVPNSAALTATRAIIAPSVPKVYVISNNSSGGQAVRIKTSGSTTTCLIPNGQTKTVVCDGTNFSEAVTAADVLTLGANPTSALQATTKQYVDAADALKLNLSGGTMTGALNLIASTPTGNNATSFNYVNTNYVQKTGSGTQTIDQFLSLNYTPTLASHAIPKSYADSNFVGLNNVQTIAGTKTFSTNVSLSGSAQLILPNAPLTGTQATNKAYVDGVAASGQTYVDTYFALKSTRVIAGSGIAINGVSEGTLGSNLTISVVGGGTVTSISATSPLHATGSAAVSMYIDLATSSTSGYLSSTDWNTFYNKMENTAGAVVSALGSTPVGYATYATAPSPGVSFVTSANIGSQTVSSCTGNAGTVTNGVYTNGSYANPAWITSLAANKISGAVSDSSALGGVAASLYATDAEVAAAYLPLTAGSSKPLTGMLFGQNPSFTTSKTITGVWPYGGNYYPFTGSFKVDTGSNYAAFAIGQFNNSTLSGSDPQVPILITTAGQVNFNYLCSFADGINVYGGTKNFFIQHPIVEDKNLIHAAVEAPRADLIYRGTITLSSGQGSVVIDEDSRMTSGTFAALTQNAEVVALHNKTGFTRLKSTEIVDGAFTILAEDSSCTDTVSWVVMAERNDTAIHTAKYCDADGRLVPEQDKPEE